MRIFFLIIFYLFFVNVVFAQSLSNIIEKEIPIIADTVNVDTLSIVPNTLSIKINGQIISDSLYSVDYEKSALLFSEELLSQKNNKNLKATIKYRVFPLNFTKAYYHKTTDLIDDSINRQNNKRYKLQDNEKTFFSSSQLSKSGSISRGINFGNKQDASVNSDFNLQLSGKISPEISISANISDNNIPVQADGTSQNLREFDKVFIELFSKKSKLKVGDFEISKPKGYFMNYNKKLQGLGFNTKFNTKKKKTIETSLNGAISKGKYNRQKIVAVEGNQGPYKLQGANNEAFIIVLSGSEKVYIDGELIKRGNENDYIINYNSAELTFTAKRPITKDTRIIAEFEYSEMSYARFILSSETKIQSKNSNIYFNIFSESDAKNQNLRQDLSDEQKLMFHNIGDNLQEALVQNIQKIDTFNIDEILYRRTDSLVSGVQYSNVFVYSTDSLNANFRLGFSFVGENKGNYVRKQSGANGRIYKWVAPISGVKQGDYEPLKILISPKKKQMLSLGGNFKLKNTNVNFETAISNNDINTFSEKDKSDDIGFALKFGITKNLLKKDTSKVSLNIGANYFYTHKNFSVIESFRMPEFTRDWNLQNSLNSTNEHIANLLLEFKKKDLGQFAFYTDLLNREDIYFGNKNRIKADFHKNKMSYFADINRLVSNDTIFATEFIRYDFKIERKGKFIIAGIRNTGEKNIFKTIKDDSLSFSSYRFNRPEIYLRTNDNIKTPFKISYINREDFLPYNTGLYFVSNSHDFKFSGTPLKTKKQIFKTSITYRTLNISDTTISDKHIENTLTGKAKYSLKLFKGSFVSSLFGEHASGNELVREFAYLEVQNGQGLFTWEDFNNNNIKELNEFVKANFQDQANYIRVSLPGNIYKRVYNQKFSYTLSINPKRIWFKEKGIKNILSSLSNRFSYKLNRKINENADYYSIQTADSNLLSLTELMNNNFRVLIQQTKTTLNFVYISNKSKILLVNGIDTRRNKFYSFAVNQKYKSLIFMNTYKKGNKNYNSDFFSESNYKIDYNQNETSLTYRIDKKTDVTAKFSLKNKNNLLGEEIMKSYNAGGEYKFASQNGGNIMLKFDYIDIEFSGTKNTSVSYEILEGLKTGNNYVWSVLWFKRITKYLQLELNYSGRKSEDNKVIHSGGVSVRAIF